MVTGWLDRVFHLLPTVWSAIRRSDVDLPWDWLVALFVFPGFVAMLLLWAVVRLTFRRTGVGGVLQRMKARPPRSATWPSSGWPTWCRRSRWPPRCRRRACC